MLVLFGALAGQARTVVPKLDLSWNDVVMFFPSDAIALSRLPARERHLLARVVGDDLVSPSEPKLAARQRLLVPSALVKLVALGVGRREAVVQAPVWWCSADGNCPVWVFNWTGSHWRQLLSRGAVEGIFPQPTQSHGLRDIVLQEHGSATGSDVRLYRFDGSRYEELGCWHADWENGDQTPPDLTPCGYR